MDARRDLYEILGVSPRSEEIVIRAAYRALKEQYSAGGRRRDAWDVNRAGEIDAAYAVLRDPAARRAYDREREAVDEHLASAQTSAARVAATPDFADRRPAGPKSPPGGRGRRRARVATLAVAAVLAIGLGLLAGSLLRRSGGGQTAPAAKGLTIRKRYAGQQTLVRPLPCYVNGHSVGLLRLLDCARRNGVATGPLDVGLDGPTPLAPAPETPPAQLVSPPPSLVSAPHAVAPLPPPRSSRASRPDLTLSEAARPSVRASRDATAIIAAFYAALGAGDGARAAALVEPEKRYSGPLSAAAMSRFYGSLRQPLRLTALYPLDPSTVFVRYRFVASSGRRCAGAANVVTTRRGDQVLIAGIRAFNGC